MVAQVPNTFILDSGAFSVWNAGADIDLDEYIQFCKDHPKCTYFVALDHIPGRPGDKGSLTPEAIQFACQKSWDNYQTMLKAGLPIEKVIPVFHMNDSFDWLEKYMDFGTPYIGISPANDSATNQKLAWLNSVKPYIFDSSGNPLIKTHGFAVTSFRLMHAMQWHSVDSASWLKQAAYGTVYTPYMRDGEYAYHMSPLSVNFSPRSPANSKFGHHINNLSPTLKQYALRYLEETKSAVGSFKVVDVPEGYKRRPLVELWWDSKKRDKVIRAVEPGLCNCRNRRFRANALFLQRANEVVPVDHIYFAAGEGSVHPAVEAQLRRRLMSYHALRGAGAKSGTSLAFHAWLDRL